MAEPPLPITELPRPADEADIAALAGVHLDAIASGASVSFMADTPPGEVLAFWREAGSRRQATILVARDAAGRIVGTVQLQPAWAPNQPHRAEVAKLLVHRDARRRGLGEARGGRDGPRTAGSRANGVIVVIGGPYVRRESCVSV